MRAGNRPHETKRPELNKTYIEQDGLYEGNYLKEEYLSS